MPLDDLISPHLYSGPLKVTFSGVDQTEGQTLIPLARIMLGKAQASADAGQVPTFSSWYTTDSGITIKVMRAADICMANISRPVVVAEPKFVVVPEPGIPMPYAGVVVPGLIDDVERPTEKEPDRKVPVLDSFSANSKTAARMQKARDAKAEELRLLTEMLANATGAPDDYVKSLTQQVSDAKFELDHLFGDTSVHEVLFLGLKVPQRYNEFYNNPVNPPQNSTTPKPIYSQFRLIKPTMFTGRMRAVVQFLMGFGRQGTMDVKQAYGPNPSGNIEVAPDFARPDDKDSTSFLGSLKYWPHFHLTHGVYKTSAGRYYLIEISQARGVVAMRLPVIPKTGWLLSEAVKQHFSDVPLGYDFPRDFLIQDEIDAGKTETKYQAAVRQGWVKVLIPPSGLAEFYSLQGTYEQCGWAFSYSGSKADNVGYNYPLPRPYDFPHFQHWHISIDGGDGTDSVNLYDYQHDDNGFDHSIVGLTATARVVSDGPAVDISIGNKPFKVPVIDNQTGSPGVVSFDMEPLNFYRHGQIEPDYLAVLKNYPVCDTTVHVFYDDEELVWLRFYNDVNAKPPVVTTWDDRDGQGVHCEILGQYTRGSLTTPQSLPKSFYSNRVDTRQIAPSNDTFILSAGSKVWQSPYMSIAYNTEGFPPLHFGYEDSANGYDQFSADYESLQGSPWSGKRHGFWVKEKGHIKSQQYYAYSSAIPLTDRECFYVCQRQHLGQNDIVDRQYTALVMQYVYYTYPTAVLDPDLGTDHEVLPGNDYYWWQLRDDTVKYLRFQYFDQDHNWTKEVLEPPSTILSLSYGVFTAPSADYSRSTTSGPVDNYTITTVDSAKLGGHYPHEMIGSGDDFVRWENAIPSLDDEIKVALLWATKSVLGAESAKQHTLLDGAMAYSGLNKDKLTEEQQGSPFRQVTFVGEL